MKPYIIIIDFLFQSILVGINVWVLLLMTIYQEDYSLLILALLFLCGLYQLIASSTLLLCSDSSSQFIGWRRRHLWGSLFYLAFLCLLAYFKMSDKHVWIALLIVIPQIIFFSYYGLTILELRHWSKNERK